MEGVALLVPPLLPAMALALYAIDRSRALAALLRARYPNALDEARGHPLSWYDWPDALALRERKFRERAIRATGPGGAADSELAAAAARVAQAVRWQIRAGLAGLIVGLTVCIAVGRALA